MCVPLSSLSVRLRGDECGARTSQLIWDEHLVFPCCPMHGRALTRRISSNMLLSAFILSEMQNGPHVSLNSLLHDYPATHVCKYHSVVLVGIHEPPATVALLSSPLVICLPAGARTKQIAEHVKHAHNTCWRSSSPLFLCLLFLC